MLIISISSGGHMVTILHIQSPSPVLSSFLLAHWGGDTVVSRGRIHKAKALSGFAAMDGEQVMGLITYDIRNDACEIVTLDSLTEHRGIGTALLVRLEEFAKAQGCARLWLITTNDNTYAMRFYQKRGFTMAALHRDAIAAARRIKPAIPLIGLGGIPILHEIEFEKQL